MGLPRCWKGGGEGDMRRVLWMRVLRSLLRVNIIFEHFKRLNSRLLC